MTLIQKTASQMILRINALAGFEPADPINSRPAEEEAEDILRWN
jgi:hypothetical protein